MNGKRGTVPLWIIGGFLGSGKTTLLNRLIGEFAPDPIGVLVNDFGTIGVDRFLLESGTSDAIRVIDLNGGQIFCSCISGSFVDRIGELAAAEVEAILVESSGLAKPRAMGAILDEARERSGNRFHYAGMVTVVDTLRFSRLEQVVNAVDEQIVYADLVVLNKTDVADGPSKDFARRRVRELNPVATVVETSFGRMERENLPDGPRGAAKRTGPAGEVYGGWANAKPRCRSLLFEEPPSPDHLERLVREQAAAGALRIKGFVRTTSGDLFVSAVGDTVEIGPAAPPPPGRAYGLTIFESAAAAEQSSVATPVAIDAPFGAVRRETPTAGDRCQ